MGRLRTTPSAPAASWSSMRTTVRKKLVAQVRAGEQQAASGRAHWLSLPARDEVWCAVRLIVQSIWLIPRLFPSGCIFSCESAFGADPRAAKRRCEGLRAVSPALPGATHRGRHAFGLPGRPDCSSAVATEAGNRPCGRRPAAAELGRSILEPVAIGACCGDCSCIRGLGIGLDAHRLRRDDGRGSSR